MFDFFFEIKTCDFCVVTDKGVNMVKAINDNHWDNHFYIFQGMHHLLTIGFDSVPSALRYRCTDMRRYATGIIWPFGWYAARYRLLEKIRKSDLILHNDKWPIIESLCNFLRLFKRAVEILSAEKYVTLSCASVLRIENDEILKLGSENVHVESLKKHLRENIDKRFPIDD